MVLRVLSYRRMLLVAASVAAFAAGGAAAAQSLDEALAAAWRSNPTIQAERARLRATEQVKAQAIAGVLPQVTAGGSYQNTENTTTFNPTVIGGGPSSRNFTLQPLTAQIQGELVVFDGFRNINAIRQANARIRAGGAQLAAVEQQVLTRAATAYFDVVRDIEVFEATANNVQVLLRQRDEAQLRFEVGEVTRTDVAQAEARLERARAQLTSAQAQLAVSRAAYVELVGDVAGDLDEDPPTPQTPETLAGALEAAKAYSPALVAAREAEAVSRRQVQIAKGAFSPQVALTAGYQYADEPSAFALNDEQFAYGVRAQAPIFLGGLNLSRVREAKALNEAERMRVAEAERRVLADVTSAWERLSAARANIVSAEAQIAANQLALDGVRREAQLGARTTLDVLDAEQEFLNAKVSLANAERDARAAAFTLLAAVGVLTLEGVSGDGEGAWAAPESAGEAR